MLGTSQRRRKTAHELLEEEFRKRPELKVMMRLILWDKSSDGMMESDKS